jgi:glucose repression regulatory protein TUP1
LTSIGISPDDTLLLAGGLDSTICMWEISSRQLLGSFRGHTDSVYSVAFMPDGLGFVSGSLDNTIKHWEIDFNVIHGMTQSRSIKDVKDEKVCALCIQNQTGHQDYVINVSISPNGQWIASGSKDNTVMFWDKSGTPHLMLKGHNNTGASNHIMATQC